MVYPDQHGYLLPVIIGVSGGVTNRVTYCLMATNCNAATLAELSVRLGDKESYMSPVRGEDGCQVG